MAIIATDNRGGKTEKCKRGNFLAPDVSVLICEIPQVDGGTRRVYAHTRALAKEWRPIARDRGADALPQWVIALITDSD